MIESDVAFLSDLLSGIYIDREKDRMRKVERRKIDRYIDRVER